MALVKKAPRAFTLGSRDGEHDLQIREGNVHTRCISGPFKILDYSNGVRREAGSEDCLKASVLQDALEHISFTAGLVYPFDIPPKIRDIALLKITLENSGKHIFLNVYSGRGLKFMIEMLLLLVDRAELARRPLLSVNVTPISPLIYTEDQLDVLIDAASYKLPIQFGSTPITGMTAPITLAGAMTIYHAEILAGVAIAQAVQPGSPAIYEPRPTTTDLRTMNPLWGSIEWGMASAAGAQLARIVDLPSDLSGGNTDSKVPDQQATAEQAMNLILIGLSRPDIVSGLGNIETINTASFEQLVIENELCGMMYRALEGIEVSEETLATDLIRKLGPGGSFLEEPHTLKYYETEHYRYGVFDRDKVEKWAAGGGKDALAVAHERVEEILTEHEPAPLDEKIKREMETLLAKAAG
jgi:trimethylamine--corrinoid protein Co-methyltransferase